MRSPTTSTQTSKQTCQKTRSHTSNSSSTYTPLTQHIKKTTVKGKPKPNVLVFLTSIPVIKSVIEKKNDDDSWKEIQKDIDFSFEEFHGALSPTEKNKVLEPDNNAHDTVRIILTTRIAETAVTIKDVAYVLDSGWEREQYINEITSLSYNREEYISKSSAIQRKGRAGRTCSGYCYRMYREEDYQKFEDNKKPEIVRTDISGLVLFTVELSDFFKLSDLMFYELVVDRTTEIMGILESKGCIETDPRLMRSILTDKGHFVIESSLETNSGIFLFENLIKSNLRFGVIATVILERPAGYFRSNDTLRKLTEGPIGLNSPIVNYLGDLAPIIYLFETYDSLTSDDRKWYEKDFGITNFEVRNIKQDVNRLEL